MSLTEHTKQQLSLASRSFIAGAMGQLPVQGENVSQWLMPGQRYEAANISGLLRKDAKNGTIDSQALAQRMAASVPSHVLDGWSLFWPSRPLSFERRYTDFCAPRILC